MAGDNIRRYNLVVPTLDKDGMREHRNPVGTDVVIKGGQADNIKPASTKLASLSLAVALPWGDNWPPRGRGSVVGGNWMIAWWCGQLGRVLGDFQGRLRVWVGDLGTSIETGGRSGPCVASTFLNGEAVWFEANAGAEGCVCCVLTRPPREEEHWPLLHDNAGWHWLPSL